MCVCNTLQHTATYCNTCVHIHINMVYTYSSRQGIYVVAFVYVYIYIRTCVHIHIYMVQSYISRQGVCIQFQFFTLNLKKSDQKKRWGARLEVFICIYVYMYICIYVYMYIYIYIDIWEWRYICIHVCMYICIHVCKYAYMYIYRHMRGNIYGICIYVYIYELIDYTWC